MSNSNNFLLDGWENPMGTKGFAFIAFASLQPETMAKKFSNLGFVPVKKHKNHNVTFYQQGNIIFILNAETQGFAYSFAKQHGDCAYAMGFKLDNADSAHQKLLALGAEDFSAREDSADLNLPAIKGIGGSILYLCDENKHFDACYDVLSHQSTEGAGLTYLDHVTHNVFQGNMDEWAGFYEKLFNFKEIRYFDIEGKLTGLKSRAMTSPCGNIRIPINESSDSKSQIAEYLEAYKGEGIQHIAFGTDNIYHTVTELRTNQVGFLSVPDTYYEKINTRVPNHNEDIEGLKSRRILIDGAPTEGQGLLLQIFTENTFGPIFFEIIQRKGNEGFGEGNFQALFESIELDQIRRGVLTDNT